MASHVRTPNYFRDYDWRYCYRSSDVSADGTRVSVLHDFYVPALKRAVRYDRVAGYFRSTSLAAASQGFSAFTAAEGRMRLIVGTNLKREDVRAILDGDEGRLAEALCTELADAQQWPESVRDGVQLLGWMVARGFLEVRVAFRVNADSGQPLPITSVADGYVHEKWAVFADSAGDRLYVSGSLNESEHALVLNAENIDVHADWWGTVEKRRADDAETGFERLWRDENPHMRILTIPEAVRQRLIDIAEGMVHPTEVNGSSAVKPEVAPPSAKELIQFAMLRDGPKLPGGRYVGMETAAVAPWPHQAVVARRLVETWPYSYLLCDEVGLGKTIEAGLAIRSLTLCGLAKRVLIAPPASLAQQWQREMADKFFLPFARALTGPSVRHEVIFPAEERTPAESLYQPNRVIVSSSLLSRKERREDLRRADAFDIALIDEAHYARRKSPGVETPCRRQASYGRLYQTLHDDLRPRARCLWMATATPMQLNWIEVYDLIALTHRVGAFGRDPRLMLEYYEALGALVGATEPDQEAWRFLRDCVKALQREDPFLHRYLQQAVVDGQVRSILRRWLERDHAPTGRNAERLRRFLFAAAPLSRVMLRHGRPLLDIYRKEGALQANLARREILPVPRIVFTARERTVYDALEAYCRDLNKKLAEHAQDRKTLNSVGFYLSFLRRRFASSLHAIEQTLRRRSQRVADTLAALRQQTAPASAEDDDWLAGGDECEEGEEEIRAVESLLRNRSVQDLGWEELRLRELLAKFDGLGARPSKLAYLMERLERRRRGDGRLEQTVLFTQYADTLEDLKERLRTVDRTMRLGTFTGDGGRYVDPKAGGMKSVSREAIRHRFLRGDIDILLCTDAAAEGLNLQTADLLVNYDLPWNPMKVEQRIGRIDRIGQRHEVVYVLNLCYQGSVEETVYGRLLERLSEANRIVGRQQVSLMPVAEEDFRQLAENKLDEETLAEKARQRMQQQNERAACMEMPARDLYDMLRRMQNRRDTPSSPITLQTIWRVLAESGFLRRLGCSVETVDGTPVLELNGLDRVRDGTLLTVDRELYEKGLQEDARPLHFATYGEPVFEAVLDEVLGHEMPRCTARISANMTETEAEGVGYAVCARDEHSGETAARLVCTLDQLAMIEVDETAGVSGAQLDDLRKQLRALVRSEHETAAAVARVEKDNEDTAFAHERLNQLVARSLIQPLQRNANQLFRERVNDLDKQLLQQENWLAADLPLPELRRIDGHLIFHPEVPQLGDVGTCRIPRPYVRAALDSACRRADAMHKASSRLTVRQVKEQIAKEFGTS